MKRMKSLGWLVAVLGVGACAAEATTESVPSGELVEQASEAALSIEKAERLLDRGDDPRQAATMLHAVLSDPAMDAGQRRQAVLSLSRAYEAAEQSEQAIAVIETELAAHADERNFDDGPLRRRLRLLLTGSETSAGITLSPQAPVARFAHVIAESFPPDGSGAVHAKLFIAGGDDGLSDDVGTFNLRGALRQAREEACPLCDDDVDLSRSVRRGDWTNIPEQQHRFADALLVFYFDLGRNRIPDRYERHLPMAVADVEAELEAGRSFVVAAERPGSPPTILLAAPRTAMLPDVERHLAMLDHLPTELEYAEISSKLRPDEIRAVVRGQWFAQARGCYEALLGRNANAGGKIIIHFSIDGADGATRDLRLDTDAATFQDEQFLGCVKRSAATMRFPVVGSGKTTVSYPVHFSP